MKASELAAMLLQLANEHGDPEVFVYNQDDSTVYPAAKPEFSHIDEFNIRERMPGTPSQFVFIGDHTEVAGGA